MVIPVAAAGFAFAVVVVVTDYARLAGRLTSLVLVAPAELFEMRVDVVAVTTRLALELILLPVLCSEMLDFVVAVVELRSLK